MSIPPVWTSFAARSLGARVPADARGTRITQRGEILLDSEKWAPFTAEQTFEAARAGFCWHARVKMAPLVTAVVEDAYEDGHGRLEAKVFGLIRVASGERGVALDRGELIRYLGELPWNPLAILHNPELRFDVAPSGKPRVWARDEAAYVDCTFDGSGDLVEIETTTRARGKGGPTPWSGRFLRYGELGGVRVPVAAEVSWDLPSGRAPYWRAYVETFAWR
jgi:hypothetical protein